MSAGRHGQLAWPPLSMGQLAAVINGSTGCHFNYLTSDKCLKWPMFIRELCTYAKLPLNITGCLQLELGACLIYNKETQSPEISSQQVQKLTPQFFGIYIWPYIGYRFPLSLSTIWGNHLLFNFMLKFPISTIWRNHLPFNK